MSPSRFRKHFVSENLCKNRRLSFLGGGVLKKTKRPQCSGVSSHLFPKFGGYRSGRKKALGGQSARARARTREATMSTPPSQGSADAAEVQNSLVATLDRQAAIAIYLAKASRTPRDKTSSALAAQYNITMKAVRDVWNLRTWTWKTMPYWTRSDQERFMRKHLCAQCRENGVKTLAAACKTCARPRRRGRPIQSAARAACSDAAESTLTAGDTWGLQAGTVQPALRLRPSPWPGGIADASRPNQATLSCASTSSAFFRRAATMDPQPQRHWTCTGGNDGPVLDQTPWNLGQCENDRSAAAPLGVAPAAQKNMYTQFGMQWPQSSVPAVEIPSQKCYSDLEDWLRQADAQFYQHQAQVEVRQPSGMEQPPRQPQDAFVDYEAQARAWSLLPYSQQPWADEPDNSESLLALREHKYCSPVRSGAENNNGAYPQMTGANCNVFRAEASHPSARASGTTWTRNWQASQQWSTSQASMCSNASTASHVSMAVGMAGDDPGSHGFH
jgi:hypothetical protein